MPKISLSIIGIHLLMVYFFSIILNQVEAISNNHNYIQKIYPILQNQKLTHNMLSLIQNWRRDKVVENRRRIKRKGAFFVTDLEGNPMLVVRKHKTKQPLNYSNNDLQKLGLYPPGALPKNFPIQYPYYYNNLQTPNNEEMQRQSVLAPQPLPTEVYQDFNKAPKNSLTDEYYDDFDLIPLATIKSRSRVKKKDTLISTSEKTSTILQFSEALQKKREDLDQSKGIVNVMSLLASVLEQAFSVPHGVVLPNNVKRESTSPILIYKLLQDMTSTSSNPLEVPIQDIMSISSTTEQLPIPPILMDKVIRGLKSSSSVGTSEKPIEVTTSSTFTANDMGFDGKTIKEDWRDFRLGFAVSKLRKRMTPAIREVSLKEIFTPPQVSSPPEVAKGCNSKSTTTVNSFWQDTVNKINDLKMHSSDRYKLEDTTNNTFNLTNEMNLNNNASSIDKILEIVEDIQEVEKKRQAKEDLPCNITGSWSSIAGGMLINIDYCNNTLSMFLQPKSPKSKKGILLDDGWEFKVFKPFTKDSVIIVNGLNDKCKKVVSFIGECRICSGVESITGDWLLGRPSINCKDQKASEDLESDVWTKETLTARQQKKLRSIKDKAKKRAQEKEMKKATTCSPS